MKRLILAFVTACMAMFATQSCSGQVKVLKGASAIDGVTTIYLSKTMLSLAGGISGVDGMDEIKPFIKKLNGMELVVAETADTRKKLAAECVKVVNKLKGELLTEIKDDEDHVLIYAYLDPSKKRAADDNTFDGLLMLVEDSTDYVAIYIDGSIDAAGLVESFSKKDKE